MTLDLELRRASSSPMTVRCLRARGSRAGAGCCGPAARRGRLRRAGGAGSGAAPAPRRRACAAAAPARAGRARATGTGTGPNATTPFGSIGVGWFGGMLLPADVRAARRAVVDDHHAVEHHGRVLRRSPRACAMTSDARAASRPMTTCPRGALRAAPGDIEHRARSPGARAAPAPAPTANCVRKSNGTGWFGATGAPFAVRRPGAAGRRRRAAPPCFTMRAWCGATPGACRTTSLSGALPIVICSRPRFMRPKPRASLEKRPPFRNRRFR